jgi:hypothetical protein
VSSDEPRPAKELRDVIDCCNSRRKQLIIRCEAITHHIICGKTGTIPRLGSLIDDSVSSNLNILNQGKKMYLCDLQWEGVIGLILRSNKVKNLGSNWNVSDYQITNIYCYVY